MSSRWEKREGSDPASEHNRDLDSSRRGKNGDRRARYNDYKDKKVTEDDKRPGGRSDQKRERSRSRTGGRGRDRDRERRRSRDRGSGRGEERDRGSGRREERNRERDRSEERDRSPKRDKGEKGGYRNRSPLPDQQVSFKGQQGVRRPGEDSKNSDEPPKEKEKVNFNNTGLLAAASNTLNSVVLKYTEPVDSRLPPAHTRWRLFTFKDGQIVGSPLDLNSQPAWLIGRDRLVADIPVDHPSCSKQHAVIQFRNVVKKNEYGDKEGGVRPYVVDLESANGTFLNKAKLDDRRFVELREGDMLVFGESTREYILMVEKD